MTSCKGSSKDKWCFCLDVENSKAWKAYRQGLKIALPLYKRRCRNLIDCFEKNITIQQLFGNASFVINSGFFLRQRRPSKGCQNADQNCQNSKYSYSQIFSKWSNYWLSKWCECVICECVNWCETKWWQWCHFCLVPGGPRSCPRQPKSNKLWNIVKSFHWRLVKRF